MDIEDDTLGSGLADANTWLRERRARRLEPAPPQRRRTAITLVFLLHVMLVLALRAGMRVRFDQPPPEARPLVVRFDTDDEAPPADPALALAPPQAAPLRASVPPRRADRPPVTPRERTVATRASDAGRPATTLRLFEPDGSLRLSREVVEAAAPRVPEPAYRERAPAKKVWRADRPAVVYAPTRLERYWKPDQENLAQELVRKYPVLGLVLQNPGGKDRCPPRSTDPDCEGEVDPAFPDDPYPDDEWLE